MLYNHKSICRKLAPEGWHYTGYFDGFYHFQTGNYFTGFIDMCLLEEDLTFDNVKLMADNGLTRSR